MAKKILAVFDTYTLEHIGLITKYKSVTFTKKSKDTGSFELWCDLIENNVQMVQKENLIYLENDKVGIVQYVEEQVDDNGVKSLNVKGKTIKYYMAYRIIMGTYNASNMYVSDIMNQLVKDNFVEPVDGFRRFEHMCISEDSHVGAGPQVTLQKTGGEVLEALDTLASSYSFCYDVTLNQEKSMLEFKAYQGMDRTINQQDRDQVVISTDLKDIINSKYIRNTADEKNVALVAGAGDGADRKTLLVGIKTSSGVDRKEMFVDARDISVSAEGEDGNQTTLTDEQYDLLLKDRGEAKISEQRIVESFDAEVRTSGGGSFTYGVDYFLGDTITAMDRKLGVTVNAEVTEAEEIYSGTDGHTINLTFGYSQPTVMDKVKSVGKEASSSTSTSDVSEKIGIVDKKMDGILNLVYPIGAIYMSVVSTSPSLLFGGTWERIEDKFLLSSGSAYAAGSSGGEATHTLLGTEMPAHTHIQNAHNHTQNAHTHTQNSHNHTQNAHTHTQNSHNHTQDAHTHNCGQAGYTFMSSLSLNTDCIAVRRVTVPSSGSILAITTNQNSSDYREKSMKSITNIQSVNPTNNAATATNQNSTPTNNATTATNQNTIATNNTTTATNQNAGGGVAHNNMPPYLTVNVWKRTV